MVLLLHQGSVLRVQVGDGSMQCASAVPSLRALLLGSTKVQDPGLAMLAALPGLAHLVLTAEGITHTGLQVTACPLQAHSSNQCCRYQNASVFQAWCWLNGDVYGC